MTGLTDIGILGGLVGIEHDRAPDLCKQHRAIHNPGILIEGGNECGSKNRVVPLSTPVNHRFKPAGSQYGTGFLPDDF